MKTTINPPTTASSSNENMTTNHVLNTLFEKTDDYHWLQHKFVYERFNHCFISNQEFIRLLKANGFEQKATDDMKFKLRLRKDIHKMVFIEQRLGK